MISTRSLLLSLLAWLAVGIFWLVTTRDFHPNWTLASVATGSLIAAYAAVSYANHLVLIPRYLRRGQPGRYAASLVGAMLLGTALALAVLKPIYIAAIGVDLVNPLGYDFALDFFGMAVHVAGATGVVRLHEGKTTRPRPPA